MATSGYWFETHDGLTLYSRVYAGPSPGAPVVLCLHGLMRNNRDFEDLASALRWAGSWPWYWLRCSRHESRASC
jgi:alpha-beta hydrolase superfamily lysophospholipase